MSGQRRQKRIPISCEPCRLRKIRCSRPRGPPPCETCVKRNLASSCQYAHCHQVLPLAPQDALPSPISERSASNPSTSLSNEDLAARVANLEALIQRQAGGLHLPPTRPVQPVPRIKGMLSTSEMGHVRFIPCTRSVADPQQATRRSIDLSAGPYPLGKKHVEVQHLFVDLPSRGHCRHLKEVYFESFAPLFHILHDPTFNNQYEEFEQTPESMPLSWLALLFAILGTSVMALGPSSDALSELSLKRSIPEQIAELSERYRNAALKCLDADNYLWQQNVTTLQALIILIYGINHSHGQTWTLLGMTYHIALSLGCHVDPNEFNLDVVSSEERRRCWAGVMMLYMIQNMSMGNLGPNPWDASEGVQMPSDLNDIDLVADEYVLPTSKNYATQMSYLLLKFRLYHISDEIASVIRNSPKPLSSLIERLDGSISGEQQSWYDKYTTHQALAVLPTCHRVHFNILQGYAHQLVLLLHNHAMRTSTAETLQFRRSISKVLNSAKEQLQTHNVFFTEPDYIPFGWYLRGICSFHAYHAAVSLVTVLIEQPWDETHCAFLPLLQQCATRFEALAEVSVICSKAAPVLRDMLHTIDTWSIELDDHQSVPSTHLDSQVVRDGHELGEPSETAQSRISDLLAEFDPHFWLTSFGNWSQETISPPQEPGGLDFA